MSTVHAFMIAAVVVTAIAAWQDYKTGHIANWLTLGALGLAPLAHFAVAGITAFTTFGTKVQQKIQNQGNALPG
jgi:Flp pilus assembly protein protease CpaA